jgi:predicted unusual protein kinase regulating ubiquinone biosynthesis (AarF/ABC1/UbiB family)
MFFISQIKNLWKIYEIQKLINNINTLETITDEYCENIKQKIFEGGCIFIKFGQWIISKMKTEANLNPKIAKFCDYFEDIFEQCPKHETSYSIEKFSEDYGYDLGQFIDIKSLNLIASGSVGQVYKAELILPVWLYNNKVYHETTELINDLFENEYKSGGIRPSLSDITNNENIKKITTVAIKIKHPNVNSDIKDKIRLFNLLSWIQSKPCLKRRFGLHLDFQEFINNILQQIDFNNEKNNCERFRENFANERLVYFPKVLYSTEDIVISEFIDCDEFNDMPKYAQLMTCYNFTCMVSKMMLIDNFAHLDLHHKNWKIKRVNDKDYQIIVFDYGIVYESPSIELSRKVWDAFEGKDFDMINSIINNIIVGEITDDVKNEFKEIIKFYSTSTLDLNYILGKLTSILAQYNCKLSAYTLNLALTLTLIDNVLKKHNIMNNVKPVTNHYMTIREKHLDLISYCNGKKVYKDLSDYLKNKINENNNANSERYSRDNIFVHTNDLDLDLPE